MRHPYTESATTHSVISIYNYIHIHVCIYIIYITIHSYIACLTKLAFVRNLF